MVGMTAVIVFFFQERASDVSSVVLHYNVYFGIDAFGPWQHLLFFPMYGISFVFLNILGGWYCLRRGISFPTSLLTIGTFIPLGILVAVLGLIIAINR